jgi:Glycolipid 2-alpha-mannosyltransferase
MNIFIFHTNEFNKTDVDKFESRLGASYRQKIHLIDLAGSRFWGRPQNLAKSNRESWYAYPLFSEGYRHMMRFFAMEIWNFFAEWNNATGCAYRYIFRMDEDSFLHSPIRYDIFDFMRSNEYVYGYRMCTYEMAVAKRMWTRWQQQRIDWKPKRELDDDNLSRSCGFYNNFFVADLEFFLGDEVRAFLNFIARRGHIYKWRLGDLVIHSMVVYGYAEAKQVHRFLDFTYEHGTMNQTSGCLVWGGIQAGYNDPKARETLDEYFTNMIVDKNCSANATFLQQHDLSPSYIHHLPFSLEGGRLALHTIAAGGVELSGKGILSG